jgi:Glycosyl hydrolases family 38 C-terminal domain
MLLSQLPVWNGWRGLAGGVLYTDANGREMLPRMRDARSSWPYERHEPVAGNYAPITTAAALSDGRAALGLATDRAQGAASLSDGAVEVMLHRCLLAHLPCGYSSRNRRIFRGWPTCCCL